MSMCVCLCMCVCVFVCVCARARGRETPIQYLVMPYETTRQVGTLELPISANGDVYRRCRLTNVEDVSHRPTGPQLDTKSVPALHNNANELTCYCWSDLNTRQHTDNTLTTH